MIKKVVSCQFSDISGQLSGIILLKAEGSRLIAYLSCAYSEDQSLPSSPFCPSSFIKKVFAGK